MGTTSSRYTKYSRKNSTRPDRRILEGELLEQLTLLVLSTGSGSGIARRTRRAAAKALRLHIKTAAGYPVDHGRRFVKPKFPGRGVGDHTLATAIERDVRRFG